MGWAYKLSPEAQKLDLETVLKTLAKHRMDFTAAARELRVKTIDLYRFASRNPRVLDDLFGAELDRVSKSVTWFDQALSGEHGINVALDVSKFVLKNSPAARQVGWGAPDATVNVVQAGSQFEQSTVKLLDGEVVKQPSDDAAQTPS
ncbi:MAG TPA: hypothetical protein VGG77_13660 [Roseiarcus sp.]